MPDRMSLRNTLHAIESAIDITQKRHGVIASNIANLDTPNYRARDLDFKKAMAQALETGQEMNLVRTNPGHIGSGVDSLNHTEVVDESAEFNGINWVNIDQATVKMIENTMMYRTATETLLRKITLMKEVIREGGR